MVAPAVVASPVAAVLPVWELPIGFLSWVTFGSPGAVATATYQLTQLLANISDHQLGHNYGTRGKFWGGGKETPSGGA